MSLFPCKTEQICIRNKAGAILLNGFTWTERDSWDWRYTQMLLAFFSLVSALLIFANIGKNAPWLSWEMTGVVFFAAYAVYWARGALGAPTVSRGVIFDRNGKMAYLCRLPTDWPWSPTRETVHARVRLIEGAAGFVNIYFDDGAIQTVSKNLSWGEEHLVAVQLTKALQDMRESLTVMRPAASAKPGSRPSAAID